MEVAELWVQVVEVRAPEIVPALVVHDDIRFQLRNDKSRLNEILGGRVTRDA